MVVRRLRLQTLFPSPSLAHSHTGSEQPRPLLGGVRAESARLVLLSPWSECGCSSFRVWEDDYPHHGRLQTTSACCVACKQPRKNNVSSVISNEGETIYEAEEKDKKNTQLGYPLNILAAIRTLPPS